MLDFGISEFWMPAATGALFILPLFAFTYLLEQIPPPTAEDISLRTERKPMNKFERNKLFNLYAPGLILLISFYMILTAYRDFRDNFAMELWDSLGFAEAPYIFTISEIPIAVVVLVMMGMTMLIKDNKMAMSTYFYLVLGGALIVGISTVLFTSNSLPGPFWMVLVGLGLYIAYVPFNCILFDRMIAAVQFKGNAGFLIYVADAFGYVGSILILLYKDFAAPEISWLAFFTRASFALTIVGAVLIIMASIYFKKQLVEKTLALNKQTS